MTDRTSRRLRNAFFVTLLVLLVGFPAVYCVYPSVWQDQLLLRLARGSRLEEAAVRQLHRRHGTPLMKDILDGRFGPGTPVADVAAVYPIDTGRHYGRFVEYYFPTQYVEVVAVDGRVVRAEFGRFVLCQSLTADEEAERRRALDAVLAEVRRRDRTRKALRGLIGFGAAADPLPKWDPFGPPAGAAPVARPSATGG